MSIPWKVVVLSDLGTPRPRLVSVDREHEWLRELGVGASVSVSGAPSRIDLSRSEAFELESIRGALGDSPDAGTMNSVLHSPGFQKIESAFRGLRFLLEHSGSAEVELLSVPRKDLVSAFREHVFEPQMNGSAPEASIVLADFDFSHKLQDVELLKDLGGMVKVLQAPLVASASPAFFDFRYMAHLAALDEPASKLKDDAHLAWRQFQTTEEARWIALTVNRYLQRAPYEKDDYREETDEAKPETFAWGRGIWLVGAAILRSVGRHGHGLDIAGEGATFTGLPARPYPVAANETASLAAEAPLAEMKTLELYRHGFTPVVGRLRSDTVLLPMSVTVFRLHPGRLTLEGTIAYQLMAGKLAQFCGSLLGRLPSAGAEETTSFIRGELIGFLGSLAKDPPDESVSVEVEAQPGGQPGATVTVTPDAIVEGKPLEFKFTLPLRTA